jgi:hypothetical protein
MCKIKVKSNSIEAGKDIFPLLDVHRKTPVRWNAIVLIKEEHITEVRTNVSMITDAFIIMSDRRLVHWNAIAVASEYSIIVLSNSIPLVGGGFLRRKSH